MGSYITDDQQKSIDAVRRENRGGLPRSPERGVSRTNYHWKAEWADSLSVRCTWHVLAIRSVGGDISLPVILNNSFKNE